MLNMLRIRKEQIDALSDYMFRQSENRMLRHLRSTFPEETKAIMARMRMKSKEEITS